MALFRFFHRPKPKTYNYKPQFYDPEKEEIEKRISQALKSDGSNPEAMKARISSGFKQKFRQDPKLRKKMTRRSNVRLIFSIVGLILLTYLFLIKYFPTIVKLVE